jgi:Fe-S cluster biogenesis protein NfuA
MGARIDALLRSFDGVPPSSPPRERAEELVRTIVGMYGAGIERILTIVHDGAGDAGDSIFEALCEDKFVETLLCLHGLHPVPLDERVQEALDAVRPYLKSHEGGIEIVAVADGVVTLRLEGNCKGCPSSAATVKLAVERAIFERVPEIREVRAEAAPAQEKPAYDACVVNLDDAVLGVA